MLSQQRGRAPAQAPEPEATAEFNRTAALTSAVMLAALVAALSGALRRFMPLWQPLGLIVVCFLIALEAGFVHYATRRERLSLGEMGRYLVPELLLMLIAMRVVATASTPGIALGAALERWLFDPLSIFDTLFLLHVLIGLVVGFLAHATMRDVTDLAPRPYEDVRSAEDAGERYTVSLAAERAAAVRRISTRFTTGGVLLLLVLSLEVADIARLGQPGRAVSALGIGGALVYLMSGFLLYSRARLAQLQARWRRDGAQVGESVTRRWSRGSWLLIGGVLGLAAILPRTYGMGLLDTLRTVLGMIGYGAAMVGYVVMWVFSMILLLPAWLISLLAPRGGGAQPLPPMPPPPPPPPAVESGPRLLPALIFWLCMLLLSGYAASIVLQRHPGLLSGVLRSRPIAGLLRWLAGLWRDTRSWAALAGQSIQSLLSRPAADEPRRGALPRRPTSPRELVRFYYRSTLARAVKLGIGRRAGQTPYEYRVSLAERLPESKDDIEELTEAYVRASYSPRPVQREDAARARGPWERLRRRLRDAETRGRSAG